MDHKKSKKDLQQDKDNTADWNYVGKLTAAASKKRADIRFVNDVTRVQISKIDISTNKELPGAKLSIIDKDGKTVESWISGKEPHMIEKLRPGVYTLHEVTAPDGYEVAKDVKFTVKETGEIQKVTMADAPKETRKHTTTTRRSSRSPRTGDTSNIFVWILLLALGSIMFGATWCIKKRAENVQKRASLCIPPVHKTRGMLIVAFKNPISVFNVYPNPLSAMIKVFQRLVYSFICSTNRGRILIRIVTI